MPRHSQGARDPSLFAEIPAVGVMAWLVPTGAHNSQGQWVTIVSHANDETVIVRGSLGSTFQWSWRSLRKKAPETQTQAQALASAPTLDELRNNEIAEPMQQDEARLAKDVTPVQYIVTGEPRDATVWRYSYGDHAYTRRIARDMNMFHALAFAYALNKGKIELSDTSAPLYDE